MIFSQVGRVCQWHNLIWNLSVSSVILVSPRVLKISHMQQWPTTALCSCTKSSHACMCNRNPRTYYPGRPHSCTECQTNDVFRFCFTPSLAAEGRNSHESAVIMVSYGAYTHSISLLLPHDCSQGKLLELATPCVITFSHRNETSAILLSPCQCRCLARTTQCRPGFCSQCFGINGKLAKWPSAEEILCPWITLGWFGTIKFYGNVKALSVHSSNSQL